MVLGVLVQLLLGRATDTAIAKVLTDRAATVVASARADSTGTTISVPQSRLEAGVAVYGSDGTLRAGAAPDSLADQYHRVAETSHPRALHIGDYARIYALPFTTKAGTAGTVVVSERRGPYATAATYEQTADTWQKSVESWTATTNGPYSDKPYYLRVTKDANPNDGSTYPIGDSGPSAADERRFRQLRPKVGKDGFHRRI